MIEVKHLVKRFGRTLAVNDISFDVARGEIVGFLGPNGAGKTTTMRVLSSFFPATSGTVRVAGYDVATHSVEVRQRIGYLPENFPVYPEMRVEEYLNYRGQLKGLFGRRLRMRLEDVLEQCALGEARRTVLGVLSRGYRQRVGLADSLLSEPELLILDEPTLGLDPRQIRQMRDLIRGLSDRHTVLLSSHILPEVEAVCRRVLIMNRGRIVASDTPAALAARMASGQKVVAEIAGPCAAVAKALETVTGITRVTWDEQSAGEWGRFQCDCMPGTDIRSALFDLVTRHAWTLRELSVERKNLEDVFVAITEQGDDGTSPDIP